ncbi:MAG: hypothetical protein COB59_00640 [Rhodospirillaceae bacterium]|nr:MAG: hypothetical protein COB59_00640 [Rhodospirillaceae bacterium]
MYRPQIFHLRFVLPLCVVFTAFLNSSEAQSGDDSIHLISTSVSGGMIEQKGDEIVGAFATFFKEASARSDVAVDYRLVPWARAVKETEHSDNLLLFPFTRTAEREHRFTWLIPLVEDEMCFVSVAQQIKTLAQARQLKRVLVWQGTSHKAFLTAEGFENLITVRTNKKVIEVLKGSSDAAFYFMCNQAQALVDPTRSELVVKLGATIAHEAIWLVGGKGLKRTKEIDQFIQAVQSLKEEHVLK